MKLTKKQIAAGITGAAVVACLPCCIPLVAPLLAWLGVSVLGAAATGWYASVAGAFALGLAAILYVRHRIAAKRAAAVRCDCRGACEVKFAADAGDGRDPA